MMEPGWCTSMACCFECGHEWIGVHPLGADPLECPNCKSTNTYREQTTGKKDDEN